MLQHLVSVTETNYSYLQDAIESILLRGFDPQQVAELSTQCGAIDRETCTSLGEWLGMQRQLALELQQVSESKWQVLGESPQERVHALLRRLGFLQQGVVKAVHTAYLALTLRIILERNTGLSRQRASTIAGQVEQLVEGQERTLSELTAKLPRVHSKFWQTSGAGKQSELMREAAALADGFSTELKRIAKRQSSFLRLADEVESMKVNELQIAVDWKGGAVHSTRQRSAGM